MRSPEQQLHEAEKLQRHVPPEERVRNVDIYWHEPRRRRGLYLVSTSTQALLDDRMPPVPAHGDVPLRVPSTSVLLREQILDPPGPPAYPDGGSTARPHWQRRLPGARCGALLSGCPLHREGPRAPRRGWLANRVQVAGPAWVGPACTLAGTHVHTSTPPPPACPRRRARGCPCRPGVGGLAPRGHRGAKQDHRGRQPHDKGASLGGVLANSRRHRVARHDDPLRQAWPYVVALLGVFPANPNCPTCGTVYQGTVNTSSFNFGGWGDTSTHYDLNQTNNFAPPGTADRLGRSVRALGVRALTWCAPRARFEPIQATSRPPRGQYTAKTLDASRAPLRSERSVALLAFAAGFVLRPLAPEADFAGKTRELTGNRNRRLVGISTGPASRHFPQVHRLVCPRCAHRPPVLRAVITIGPRLESATFSLEG